MLEFASLCEIIALELFTPMEMVTDHLSSSCSNNNNDHVYSVPLYVSYVHSVFLPAVLSPPFPAAVRPALSHILFSFHYDPRDLFIYLYCVSLSCAF